MHFSMTTNVWLSVSVFSWRANWHMIIARGINNYLNTETGKRVIACTISFNYLAGENLRMAVCCHEDDWKDVAYQIDNYFRSFLSQTNLLFNENRTFSKAIFMPCQSNAVRYGLFDPNRRHYQNVVAQEISRTLLACVNEQIDEEYIITLSYYLLSTLIITQQKINFRYKIDNAHRLFQDYQAEYPEILHQQYLRSAPALNSIIKDIKSGNIDNWGLGWHAFCTKELQNNESVHEFMSNVFEQIVIQLGMSPGMAQFSGYLIKKTLIEAFVSELRP